MLPAISTSDLTLLGDGINVAGRAFLRGSPYLFCSPSPLFLLLDFWFVIIFFINLFQKTVL